jgi:sugar phosphate isomerase/epimerase
MTNLTIGAITDEFSSDLGVALDAMSEVGMSGVELRVVDGKNVIDLTDDEIEGVRRRILARGMHVVGIASPVLKCALPGAAPVDSRLQMDTFGSAHQFSDQPRLADRAFEIAAALDAPIIRVFSYWRTTDPGSCLDQIASALYDLARRAAEKGVTIGLENEHACNIATGEETARVLAVVQHPALKVIWDPANALVAGETPFPDGYARIPVERIVHVHAKDCRVKGHAIDWGPLGEMDVDWKGQVAALVRDGYRGAIHLETHWLGPNGDKLEASLICGRSLRTLVEAEGWS